jgi:glutaredoxin
MSRSSAGHLRLCPHCEEAVYRRAVKCPHCESNLRLDNEVRTRFTTLPSHVRGDTARTEKVLWAVMLVSLLVALAAIYPRIRPQLTSALPGGARPSPAASPLGSSSPHGS